MRTLTLVRVALALVLGLQSPLAIAGVALRGAAMPSCCSAKTMCEGRCPMRAAMTCCTRESHDPHRVAWGVAPCHRATAGPDAATTDAYVGVAALEIERSLRVQTAPASNPSPLASNPVAPSPPPPRA